MTFCAACGHEDTHDDYECWFRHPDAVFNLSERARTSRVRGNGNWCVLDEQRYYFRAMLPIPVDGRIHPYYFGVWIEVEYFMFTLMLNQLLQEDKSKALPCGGWIANDIPGYSCTYGLRGSLLPLVHTTAPIFTLSQSEHLLYDEQRFGVSEMRVEELSRLYQSEEMEE
jgi:hypothetical protein